MLFFNMAWRNVWRNRRRSLLTVLAISLGLAFNIFMRAIGDGFHEQMVDNSVRSHIGHLEVHRAGYHDDPGINKTLPAPQEIERMRLANELAALGMEHARRNIRPGMKASEVAARIEGHIHAIGIGYQDKVEMARAFTLVWSGPGIATFTPTGHRPVVENEPTLVEIWVCADGYWTDLTKNICPGTLSPKYVRLLESLLEIFHDAAGYAREGASLAELDRRIRHGIELAGYPGQPSHPVAHGVGARAHEPPWAHQAGSGTIRRGMVLAIEPGAYWPGGGGLRLEDNFLINENGNEKLCTYPDDFRT